jgi:hypothetical protein
MTGREKAHACGLALLCLSAPLFLLGAGSAALTLRFLSRAEAAVAEVVSLREAGSRSRHWETTLAVSTPEGTRLTASWKSETPLNIGQAVRVLYRRDAPVQMRPDDARSVWGWARLFGSAGVACALLGGAALIVGRFLRRRPA